MSKWQKNTLGELTSYISKGIPPKYTDTVNEDTIYVLNQKCNRDFYITYDYARLHDNKLKPVPDERMLKEGDVLINSTGAGTAGRVAQIYQIPFKTTIDGHMILLRSTNVIDTIYYGYAIKSLQKQIENYAEGSTGQTEINRDRLLNDTIIAYPSDLSIQRYIGLFLLAIDNKININKQINDNLAEQTQIIFDYFFCDKDKSTNWENGLFSDIVNFSNGYAFKSKELLNAPQKECFKVFKQGHINRGGGFNTEGTKSWYPSHKCNNLKKYILKKGDVLMAMTDMKDNVAILGNTALMNVDNEYIVNQRVGLLRSNGYKNTSYAYIYLLTNSNDFLQELRSHAHSGVQVNLSSDAIKNMPILIAPEEVNHKFNNLVLPLFELIMKNDIENKYLKNLRDTLLPKLMSGVCFATKNVSEWAPKMLAPSQHLIFF